MASMTTPTLTLTTATLAGALALAVLIPFATPADAQGRAPAGASEPAAAPAAPAPAATAKPGKTALGGPAAATAAGTQMKRLDGVWVEGPGFKITYGGGYEACTKLCLGTAKCVMVEYYRPERKCNLYDRERPRLKGGSSVVGLRQ
jgi:hypothetical protein